MRHPLCEVQRIGDELWFFGEIDASNADELAARAVAELQAGAVGLDLSRVRFFAVAGLRIVLAAQASARSLDGGLPTTSDGTRNRKLSAQDAAASRPVTNAANRSAR